MKMNFRKLIAFGVVFAATSFLASSALATTFPVSVLVWANATSYPNAITPGTLPTGLPNYAAFGTNTSGGSPINFYSNTDLSLASFLTTGQNGLFNGDAGILIPSDQANINNDVMNFWGETYLQNGATYSVTHDDGMLLYVGGSNRYNGTQVIDAGGPTAAATDSFTWTGTSGFDNFSLWYAEVNGPNAVLYAPGLAMTPEPPSLLLLATGLFGLAFLLFRRKIVKPIANPTMIA